MGNDRDRRRHGDDISSYWSKRRKRPVYVVGYVWNGKRRTETVPEPYDGDGRRRKPLTGLAAARAMKADREKQRRRSDWLPPKFAAAAKRDRAKEETDRRAPLRFEEARKRFLDECADEYARPDELRSTFRRLGRFFAGRMLDEVKRHEIRQYYLDRVEGKGAFADWPRMVTVRVPQTEISVLSALYTFLQDEGHVIENPCHRPRTRRKDSPLAYRGPTREAVVPSRKTLREIFAATPRAKYGGQGAKGRLLVRDEHRALFKLTYYTAARPESEPCRLLHGDVVFSDEKSWGHVIYRRTKTGLDRKVLLHPEVETDLKAVMLPEPSRFEKEAREEWAATPIFRVRRRGEEINQPWTHYSYAKAWAAIARTVPDAKGMWCRDLRKTAKTFMVDAAVPREAIDAILGHRGDVADGYYVLRDGRMREALEALSLAKPDNENANTSDLYASRGRLQGV